MADGLFDPQGGFHPLPEEIVLWPLEEMFRRQVITFLVDQELLPRDRAEMLLSWQHSGFSLHRSRRVGLEERDEFLTQVRKGKGHYGLISLHYGSHGGILQSAYQARQGPSDPVSDAQRLTTKIQAPELP